MRPVDQRFGEWASGLRTFSAITDLLAVVQREVQLRCGSSHRRIPDTPRATEQFNSCRQRTACDIVSYAYDTILRRYEISVLQYLTAFTFVCGVWVTYILQKKVEKKIENKIK